MSLSDVADLAGAAQLFDGDVAQLRKLLLQPTVEALFALVAAHADGLNAAHAKIPRPMAMPARTASSDTRTDPAT